MLRVAETGPRREPVRMDDDVVDGVVGRVPFRIERDPQVVGPEPVRPFLDEEIGAVRGGENDVSANERPRAEVEPLAFDIQLQHANVRVRVGCVGCPVDHRACRGGEEQDCEGCGGSRELRGALYEAHLLPLSAFLAAAPYRVPSYARERAAGSQGIHELPGPRSSAPYHREFLARLAAEAPGGSSGVRRVTS